MMQINQTHKPRIFHGPEKICGIGRYLADWQRENKAVRSDFIVYSDHTPYQNSHQNLHLDKKNTIQAFFSKIDFLRKAINDYDLFHFYFGKTLLPLNLDLPILKLFHKNIIMHYVGSDIRIMRIARKENPFLIHRPPKGFLDRNDFLKMVRMVWQSIWFDRCLAGKEIYVYAKSAIPKRKIVNSIMVSNTIDFSTTQPDFSTHPIPVIVHAPTHTGTKGTDYVERAMGELKSDGYIFDFQLIHNKPHDEVIDTIKNKADIVVDQLLIGGFGSLAMEGMSYGKTVCGYVRDSLRAELPDLPIVQCTINTIKEKLAWLIDHPKERIRLGKAGWEFAKVHYDRNKNCEELWELYTELLNP